MSRDNVVLPAPLVFDLDREQSERIGKDLRAADDASQPLILTALVATVGIANALHGFGLHNVLAWAMTAFWSGYVTVMWQRRTQRSIVPRERATAITFHETGVVIARGTASYVCAPRFFPFADIRSVRLTSQAIVLDGLWSVILVIPIAVLKDDAVRVMAYFEEHLVSKGMPQSSSGGVTTFLNSVWPLLARRNRALPPTIAST